MTYRLIGMIAVKDEQALSEYRSQVLATVEQYGGRLLCAGPMAGFFWNELGCADFQLTFQTEFPDEAAARRWAASPEYQRLLAVRAQAMNLTLFAMPCVAP